MKQLHSYDYGGPYAAFKGAVNFWNDIDRMINTPIWGLIQAPWQKKSSSPSLTAEYIAQSA
jgi:nitrogenase molybdenum-iron protein alpha chain